MSVLFNIPPSEQPIAPPLPKAVVDANHYLSLGWLDAFRARPYQLEEARAFLRETLPRIVDLEQHVHARQPSLALALVQHRREVSRDSRPHPRCRGLPPY